MKNALYVFKGSDHSEFFILPCILCVFLTDLHSKTMICYTFSAGPTISESKKLKITIEKFDEEENEDFCEDKYFNFEDLTFAEEKTF